MNANRYPLAHDLDGNPIELPPEAVSWRVRRRSGKQGRPQCVYHHETGAQLVIPLDATIDDLVDYGPGVYRLDAIDKDGKVIPGVVAYTEVTPLVEQPRQSEAFDSGSQAGTLIRQLVESNVRVMEAMASAFGRVRPATDEPAPVIVQQPAPTTEAAAQKFGPAEIVQLATMLPGYLEQVIAAVKRGVGQGVAQAAPPQPPPAPASEGGQAS